MVEKTTSNHGNHQPIYEQNLRFLVKTKKKNMNIIEVIMIEHVSSKTIKLNFFTRPQETIDQ